MGTDRDWERWGADDPYYGVFSIEKFRRARLDQPAIDEFFASGEAHVTRLLGIIGATPGTGFKPASILDFGCGVGRILLPLARRTGRSVGVDVSPSMMAEAARNAETAGIANLSFVLSDDRLSQVSGTFGLVHSFAVLQHIPWRRGRVIIQALADRVERGGCLAVQVLASATVPVLVRAAVRLRYAIRPLHWLRNLIKGRPLFEPAMQMHVYDVPVVLSDLRARGFEAPKVLDEPGVDGFRSVYLIARRKQDAA
jgi:2-polyprenyl-3-methyl-5-hydroxy-6-metoxy-1,4-benzoquinol methylase